MSEGEQQTRDIKNHLLFEIATEVAHRGQSFATAESFILPSLHILTRGAIQSVVSTRLSNPRLLLQQLNMAIATP